MVRTALAGVAAAVLGSAAISGCTTTTSTGASSGTAKVSKADLERDISERVANAGQAPQSVSCRADLVGPVGQSVRCEVTMSGSSGFEPIVTVTAVNGGKVDYDVTPSMSKAQLQDAVSRQAAGLNEQQVNEAARLYIAGKSLAWIGAAYGVSHTTVAAALRRNDVELRSRRGCV